MSDETTEFSDVVAVIRRGMEPAVFEQPSPAVLNTPGLRRLRGSRRAVVAIASFVLVLAIGAPLLWVRPASGPLGVPTTSLGVPTTSPPTVPPTAPLLVWPPPPAETNAPADAIWRCGEVEAGRRGVIPLDDPDYPADLRFAIDPPIPPPTDGWVVSGRGICQRPPSLVLAERTADGRSVEAEIVVWVEEETFEAEEPPLLSVEPRPLPGLERRDGFIVRTWSDGSRIEMVGALGELPVWIVAFNLDLEEAMEVVSRMTADAESGAVTVDDPGRFEVLRSGPVEAKTFNTAILYLVGSNYDVDIRRDVGAFVPYIQFKESCELLTIFGTEAVFCSEGESTSQLAWRIDATRYAVVEVESKDMKDWAIEVASALRPGEAP